MASTLSNNDYVIRLSFAFLFGAIIGLERQWKQKNAGLRTNTLVSIGAASFTLLSVKLFDSAGGDPSRLIAQIISGIGFLGAGVIMKDGLQVRGLNTAATIWCSAAVGSIAGFGLINEAMITTFAIVFTHLAFRPISYHIAKKKAYTNSSIKETFYELSIHCPLKKEANVRFWVLSHIEANDQLSIRSINRNKDPENKNDVIVLLEISTIGEQNNLLENLVTNLLIKQEVIHAGWKVLDVDTEY